VHYVLLFLKISGPKLLSKCCLEFPVFEELLLVFIEYLFHLRMEFHNRYILKFFACCKHLLCTEILRITGSCPKNAIVSDFSGDVSIPKFFAVFCNVNSPRRRLFSEIFWF
jgi:hypothetical protein